MSYSMAQITVTGKVGQDPKRRSDKAPVEFSIATQQGFADKKSTNWWTIKVWGKDGEYALDQVAKGDTVTATGRFEIRTYTTTAGEVKTSLEVNASDVVFASKPRQQSEPQRPQYPADQDLEF